MAKIKNNQEGGAILAKDPKAAAMELKKNQKTEGGARKGAAKGMDHKKGGAKYVDGAAKYVEGAADFPKKGTQEHKASVKHSESGEHLGAKRMGYNQSFGAARVSGYSKGAAKVADIMSFGASKYISGAADKDKPKKNTSGILGGDTIMGDENNDGNMVSRGLKAIHNAIQDPTMPASNNRPIIKDGKLNYDASRMGNVLAGPDKK